MYAKCYPHFSRCLQDVYKNSGKFGFKIYLESVYSFKVEFLSFEKAKEITFAENLRLIKKSKIFKLKNWIMNQNLCPKHAQRNHCNRHTKIKIPAASIKSKVNPEKEMTLNLTISETQKRIVLNKV